MSKQSISNTAPATTLPAGATIINDNFTELYNILGGSTLPTLTDGRIAFATSGAWGQSANLTFGPTAGQGIAVAAGTATTNVVAGLFTQTRNAAGVTFDGAIKAVITDTASAAGSLAMQILGGAAGSTTLLTLDKAGSMFLPAGSASAVALQIGAAGGANTGLYALTGAAFAYTGTGVVRFILGASSGGAISAASTAVFGWENGTLGAGNPDSGWSRGGSNQIVAGPGTAGGGTATSRAEINKAVTAFSDGVAKTVFTLTIPNAAHSASYLVRVTGSIGAGGAIGANEASATNCYVVTICRTAGVNAVAGISAAFGASTSAVAGATTVTCTAALAAVSGAVGATNTIDIQATITKGGGASDNHTCVATASLLNANATGVTIA